MPPKHDWWRPLERRGSRGWGEWSEGEGRAGGAAGRAEGRGVFICCLPWSLDHAVVDAVAWPWGMLLSKDAPPIYRIFNFVA